MKQLPEHTWRAYYLSRNEGALEVHEARPRPTAPGECRDTRPAWRTGRGLTPVACLAGKACSEPESASQREASQPGPVLVADGAAQRRGEGCSGYHNHCESADHHHQPLPLSTHTHTHTHTPQCCVLQEFAISCTVYVYSCPCNAGLLPVLNPDAMSCSRCTTRMIYRWLRRMSPLKT